MASRLPSEKKSQDFRMRGEDSPSVFEVEHACVLNYFRKTINVFREIFLLEVPIRHN